MNFLISAFNAILYQPLLNILILLYVYLPGHDFGVAIIILTLLIKAILFPSTIKSIKSQRVMAEIQPKIKDLQEKYKDDKQAQSKAMMELYQKAKINPMSGCLPLLLQLPILIALYQVFLRGLSPEALSAGLYGFVPLVVEIKPMFLGLLDLSGTSIYLALITGILQFIQIKLAAPKKDKNQSAKPGFASMFQGQMLFIFPLVTIFFVWKLGSIIGLYWFTGTLFSVGEHYIANRKYGQKTGETN